MACKGDNLGIQSSAKVLVFFTALYGVGYSYSLTTDFCEKGPFKLVS